MPSPLRGGFGRGWRITLPPSPNPSHPGRGNQREDNLMLKLKNIFLVFIFLGLWCSNSQAEEKKLNIVTTQTIFADLVKQLGGDKVNVKAIASPKFNIHFIQPTPSDVRAVTKADLYVNAGLDLEAWSDPLLEAVGNPELFRGRPRNVDLSSGITLLNVPTHVSRSEGDLHLFGNPHFQMNPENLKIMARTLVERLKIFDPQNAEYYEQNAQSFLKNLETKIEEWKNLCSHCRGQEILSYHEDIAYFAQFLGLKSEQFLEPKPGVPPTPQHLVFLEGYVKKNQIKAIVMPTYYPRAEANKLASKLGIKVVTICQGVGELPNTDNIITFFDYNVKAIQEALK